MRNYQRAGALLFTVVALAASTLIASCGGGSDSPTSITAPTAVTIGYAKGDLSLTDPGLQKMTASLATTSGALLQAIYAVNSFVFTDPKVTDYATYVQRQADANQALGILILYAGQTEQKADALPTSAPSTLALLSPQGAPTSFKAAASPEEVLAVLNSSKSKWPIKTLMQQYQVSAKKAQLILNNAMNGLTSQAYLDQATVETQVITRLTLVKEAAGLAVTVGSTVITAGGVGGVLTVFEAGTAIIGAADAVIKVTKAGAELAIGQDGALDEMFEKSTMVRVIADVNELVSINGLFAKSANLLDTTNKLIYVAGKLNEVFQEKKVSFGAESMTLTSFNDDFKAAYMARVKALNYPSTFPGNYVDAANQPVTVNAAVMPQAALDALDALPVDAQLAIVQQILSDSPGHTTPPSLEAGTPVTLSGTFPSTSLDLWTTDGKPLITALNSGTWSMTGAGLELDHVEQYRDSTGVLLSYTVFVHAPYGAQGTLTVTNNPTWALSPKEVWLSNERYVLSYRLGMRPLEDAGGFYTNGNVIASASISGLTAKVDYVFPKEGLGPFNRFTITPQVRASIDADIYNKDGSFLRTLEDGHDYFRLLQVVVTGRKN